MPDRDATAIDFQRRIDGLFAHWENEFGALYPSDKHAAASFIEWYGAKLHRVSDEILRTIISDEARAYEGGARKAKPSWGRIKWLYRKAVAGRGGTVGHVDCSSCGGTGLFFAVQTGPNTGHRVWVHRRDPVNHGFVWIDTLPCMCAAGDGKQDEAQAVKDHGQRWERHRLTELRNVCGVRTIKEADELVRQILALPVSDYPYTVEEPGCGEARQRVAERFSGAEGFDGAIDAVTDAGVLSAATALADTRPRTRAEDWI